MKNILTIAGSDSCAGAGIQADLKTISALGAYALTVITAVTAQNTQGVSMVQMIDKEVIKVQMKAIFEDIRVDAVKTGMMGTAEIIETVADFLNAVKKTSQKDFPLVVDPVMVAKSGASLLQREAVEAMKQLLMPLATLVTPNLNEAVALTGKEVRDVAGMVEVGEELLQTGAQWVLVKGGHLLGEPVDVLVSPKGVWQIEGKRIPSKNDHGTGCTLSSAVAVFLACGYEVPEAVKKAKNYLEKAIRGGFALGQGVGVLDHFADCRNS